MIKNLISIVALGLCALASISDAKGCYYQNKVYSIGANWVQGNTICMCLTSGKVICHRRLGKCDAWGDPHFTSFDGKRFDFQGICRYVLTRDCCGKNFTIEVEQKQWSPSTSVTDKFTIHFGNNRVVNLEKVQVLTVDGLAWPGLFYDDTEVRCEVISGYITVTLKNLHVWLRWNWQYHVQVFAHPKYQGHLCGLCADFNGDPANDLRLIPTGEATLTIPEWGKTWRTHQQPDRCKESEPNVGNDDDRCTTNKEFVEEIKKCRDIMTGSTFARCKNVLNVNDYIADCETEICECLKMGRKDCVCHALSAFERACEAKGVTISNTWKLTHGCGVCVVNGVIYEHGQTFKENCKVYECENGKKKPIAQLKNCCYDRPHWYHNGQKWRVGCEIRMCKNGTTEVIQIIKDCCRWRNKYYQPGQKINIRCRSYVCRNGKWSLYMRTCCIYKNSLYKIGTSWWDGCKYCKCYPNGIPKCQYRFRLIRCLPPRILKNCQCVFPILTKKAPSLTKKVE